MTTLLVGDVAGHLAALDEVLEPFGVSVSDSHVPDGTAVVQVGDVRPYGCFLLRKGLIASAA